MRTRLLRHILFITVVCYALLGCTYPAVQTQPVYQTAWTPVAFPSALPTLTSPPEPSPIPTWTETPNTLVALLEAYGLTPWQPSAGIESAHPITPDVLGNRATYGAFLDELERQIVLAQVDVQILKAQGVHVLVEVHWNGVSSYTENTQVEVFYRDVGNTESAIWIGSAKQGFTRLDASDLAMFIEALPGEAPDIWQGPGRVVYLDNTKDRWARGLHVIDAEGRAVVFWDPAVNAFVPWKEMGLYRYKLVDGFDKSFYGFSETELDLLWEAFIWVELGLGDAEQVFASVVSVRRTDLPLWIAGVAHRGDVRIDPSSFTIFRSTIDAPRQNDVLWMAGLLVHEAAHVNQPGECTPDYAATRGMTFEEYGLYVETGPGQAYEQEVLFLERLLELRDDAGNFLIADPLVRDNLILNVDFTRGALGQATFPNGEPVPTCATEE